MSSSVNLLFRAAINHPRNFSQLIHSKYVVARFSSSISDQNKGGKFGKLRQDDPFAGNMESGAPNMRGNNNNNNNKATGDMAKDTAKAGVAAAVDAGLKLGETAKKTMDGMWDATKETAESVRETVVADNDDSNVDVNVNDDDDDDQYYTNRQLPPSDDKHVDDLRRKAGGYDFKDY